MCPLLLAPGTPPMASTTASERYPYTHTPSPSPVPHLKSPARLQRILHGRVRARPRRQFPDLRRRRGPGRRGILLEEDHRRVQQLSTATPEPQPLTRRSGSRPDACPERLDLYSAKAPSDHHLASARNPHPDLGTSGDRSGSTTARFRAVTPVEAAGLAVATRDARTRPRRDDRTLLGIVAAGALPWNRPAAQRPASIVRSCRSSRSTAMPASVSLANTGCTGPARRELARRVGMTVDGRPAARLRRAGRSRGGRASTARPGAGQEALRNNRPRADHQLSVESGTRPTAVAEAWARTILDIPARTSPPPSRIAMARSRGPVSAAVSRVTDDPDASDAYLPAR